MLKFNKKEIVMKKLSFVIFVAVFLVLTLVLFACDNTNTSNEENKNIENNNGSEEIANPDDTNKIAKIESITGGTIEGFNISLEVAIDVEEVDLSGIIKVSENSSWQLYMDKLGQILIPTKYATLQDGQNTYYIVVNSNDNKINRTYVLTIWKNFYTNIYFKANGEIVKTIENVLSHTTVEFEPPTNLLGYKLLWNTFSYYVTEKDKTFIATCVPKEYKISLDPDGGSVCQYIYQVEYYESYTLPIPTKSGYTFLGWYNGDQQETDANGYGAIYKYTINIKVKAKWALGDSVDRQGDYVYFGMYPQTKVTNDSLIASLNNKSGMIPTSNAQYGWTSYQYYQNGNVSDYMWYKDIEFGGEKYRGVYFTSYRSFQFDLESSADYSLQDNNGYTTGTIYWFVYEPITWRILKEDNGRALILADLILDAQEYCLGDYEYNMDKVAWEYCNVRKWLNDDFYNSAFNEFQKELIIQTTLDNQTTTNEDLNYDKTTLPNNTSDNVFLVAYKDMINANYGFSVDDTEYDKGKNKWTTDYAQAQGAFTSKFAYYPDFGRWLLRSAGAVSYVNYDGTVNDFCSAYDSSYGIVPALWIKL